MRNIVTIIVKQIKDTTKNKTVLIQFIMFPLMVIVMNQAISINDMPENFFVNIFATMYIGMAPLTSIAAIISEEKEKNTLRVLLMSNVSPFQYIIGVGSYVFLTCMLGACVFCLVGGYSGREAYYFLMIMAVGILASLTIGAAIGTWSKNQMSATSVTVPVMMIFSFLPMLSMFNDTISKIAKYTYSEQISILIAKLGEFDLQIENIAINFVNICIAVFLFKYSYKKCGLAE